MNYLASMQPDINMTIELGIHGTWGIVGVVVLGIVIVVALLYAML